MPDVDSTKPLPKTPSKGTPLGEKKAISKLKPEMAPSAVSEDEGQLTNGAPEDDQSASNDSQEQASGQQSVIEDDENKTPTGVENTVDEATSKVSDVVDEASSKAEDVTSQAQEEAENVAGDSGEEIVPAGRVNEKGEVVDDDGNVIGKVAEGDKEKLAGSIVSAEGEIVDQEGNVLGKAEPVEGADLSEAAETAKDNAEDAVNKTEETKDEAQGEVEQKAPEIPAGTFNDAISKAGDPETPSLAQPDLTGPFKIGDQGEVLDGQGQKIGNVDVEGEEGKSLIGKDFENLDSEGNIVDDDGKILGKVNLLPKDELPGVDDAKDALEKTGEAAEDTENATDDADKAVDGVDGQENIEQAAEDAQETAEEATEESKQLPDISILEGLKVNKAGNIVDENGNVKGKIVDGDLKKLAGKKVDKEGKIWDDQGKVIGQAEVVPDAVENESAPFEDFPDATVDKDGQVIFEGQAIGKIVEGDVQTLIGKKVDADGDVLDKNGNVIGKAERLGPEEKEPEPEPEQIDYSMLADKKVNKAGNVVDETGAVIGRIVQGTLKYLVGKKVDKNGEIWSDQGKVIGKAEPIPDDEKEDYKDPAPFEDFTDATVQSNGDVLSGGEKIGVLVEGDAKKLKGKSVDADGDVVDRNGNVLGKAERWDAPDEEPEPEVDMSILAGKRVNKAGNLVDKGGDIYGRLIEGDAKTLAGKMSDKLGCIRNEGGDVVGKAELVPQSEREGLKEGPFTDFVGCTVNKDGKIVTASGDVVGRLIEGDAQKLAGRAVDEDGEILDKNGNLLGKAERWQEPEVEKDVNPMSGRKVNKQGEVVNEDGDVIGRLTNGDVGICAGKKIDDDGDVVDAKGTTLGHVSLLADIPEPEAEPEPEPEPEESEEQKAEKKQQEQDRKLAAQMGSVIEQSLDKIKPILRMITQTIDKEERKPEKERDEEELVKQVKPMIEEGSRVLTECNGAIRGMDPDGRIQANAKHKSASREASPEEHHLAEQLKELTGWVTETIENAKRKIEDMPHAKKELNPLWALLTEPLGQILAAVGLLLAGVLGLVGKLLSGLGLGGLLDNLLGGLGLTNLLDGLGLGSIVGSLTGKK